VLNALTQNLYIINMFKGIR